MNVKFVRIQIIKPKTLQGRVELKTSQKQTTFDASPFDAVLIHYHNLFKNKIIIIKFWKDTRKQMKCSAKYGPVTSVKSSQEKNVEGNSQNIKWNLFSGGNFLDDHPICILFDIYDFVVLWEIR